MTKSKNNDQSIKKKVGRSEVGLMDQKQLNKFISSVGNYTPAFNDLWECPVSDPAARLYGWLTKQFADANLSRKRIAKALGKCEKTITRLSDELESYNMIKVIQTPGGINKYLFTDCKLWLKSPKIIGNDHNRPDEDEPTDREEISAKESSAADRLTKPSEEADVKTQSTREMSAAEPFTLRTAILAVTDVKRPIPSPSELKRLVQLCKDNGVASTDMTKANLFGECFPPKRLAKMKNNGTNVDEWMESLSAKFESQVAKIYFGDSGSNAAEWRNGVLYLSEDKFAEIMNLPEEPFPFNYGSSSSEAMPSETEPVEASGETPSFDDVVLQWSKRQKGPKPSRTDLLHLLAIAEETGISLQTLDPFEVGKLSSSDSDQVFKSLFEDQYSVEKEYRQIGSELIEYYLSLPPDPRANLAVNA